MSWNLFRNKVAGQAYTYTEKETSGQVVFQNEFHKMFKNAYIIEYFRRNDSENQRLSFVQNL